MDFLEVLLNMQDVAEISDVEIPRKVVDNFNWRDESYVDGRINIRLYLVFVNFCTSISLP